MSAVSERIESTCGIPDIVVASSATKGFERVAESAPRDAVDAMASTYFAAYFLCRAFVREMLARRSGRFVIVGSLVRAAPHAAAAYSVLERLPFIVRDERFRRLWQTEDQAGAMVADAVTRGADLATPAWLRPLTAISSVAGEAVASLFRK